MEALAITIFCSLLLAGFFIVMFLGSQRSRRLGDEQESLLPLEEDYLPHHPPINTPTRHELFPQDSSRPFQKHNRP